MHFSRRDFLKISAALALQSCSGGLLRSGSERSAKGPLFYVPSPREYLNIVQDFSAINFDHRVRLSLKNVPEKAITHLSVIHPDTKKIKLVSVPGHIHSVLADGDEVYLVTADSPSLLYALNARTFTPLATVECEENFSFGGHAVAVPGQPYLAVTVNSNVRGKYDWITIREKSSLKEVARLPSYGFEAHDVHASPDGKRLYVGHYGSLLGTGPYKNLRSKDYRSTGKDLAAKRKSNYDPDNKFLNIYPGSVTVVETASGKMLNRLSSVDGGAHCHFVVGAEEKIYLTQQPSLIENRNDSLTNPWFGEGEHDASQVDSFVPKMMRGFGTGIAYDPDHKEVLIPARWTEDINHISENSPGKFESFSLIPHAPEMKLTHGIALYPDRQEYVVTGNNWFVTLKKGSHKFVPERSFPANLFVHAHTTVGS